MRVVVVIALVVPVVVSLLVPESTEHGGPGSSSNAALTSGAALRCEIKSQEANGSDAFSLRTRRTSVAFIRTTGFLSFPAACRPGAI